MVNHGQVNGCELCLQTETLVTGGLQCVDLPTHGRFMRSNWRFLGRSAEAFFARQIGVSISPCDSKSSRREPQILLISLPHPPLVPGFALCTPVRGALPRVCLVRCQRIGSKNRLLNSGYTLFVLVFVALRSGQTEASGRLP